MDILRLLVDYNVIPLVDIMLVLLTIVLITATFVVQGSIPVNLPAAKSNDAIQSKSIEIIIEKNGEVWLEGRKVSLDELEKILSSVSKDASVKVLADKEASVQSLVSVLDALKKLHFVNMYLRTEIR
jgi:biopolymer transport protein ExbD